MVALDLFPTFIVGVSSRAQAELRFVGPLKSNFPGSMPCKPGMFLFMEVMLGTAG